MVSGFGESRSTLPESSSCSSNNASDIGDFECNICFELAQDPIVTLCGHLFCWPCLYRWLNHHSLSHECPVCKAVIQEEKLVPLYGGGKKQTDPRSKSYPGMEIPNCPAGQRPSPPQANNIPSYGFGMMGGFVPMATARIGNFTLSTAMGGSSLFPSPFNAQFHGFSDATVHGTTFGFPYGLHAFHGGLGHGYLRPTSRGQQAGSVRKNLLLLIGFLVVLALLWR